MSSTGNGLGLGLEVHPTTPQKNPTMALASANTAMGGKQAESDNSPRSIFTPSSTNRALGETPTSAQATPVKRPLTDEELKTRDQNAIAYTRSLLEEGDTLVYIDYPGNSLLYDPTGFQLVSKAHRVHSEKLLATGSAKFTKLLLDEWKQHRMRKARGFLNKRALPPGIQYVLDLTPPDEGDDALELTTSLSCSLGIRNWYLAEKLCGVHHSIVAGKDEVAKPKNQYENSMSEIEHNDCDPLPFEGDCDTADSTSSSDDPFNIGSTYISTPSFYVPHPTSEQLSEAAIQRALRQSREEAVALVRSHLQFDPEAKARFLKVEEVLEYCPIRHRAGVERLLQVIEGKDPRLDSAPKVWTLFVLSKYFDCTEVVLDFIACWMFAEPNCRFIEVLPEVSYKIGSGLQNPLILRPAFAILVSEEALSIASRMEGKHDADRQRRNQFFRAKEDIDDNSLDAIQAAANDFFSRIQAVIGDLIDKEMRWLENLHEYSKLREFRYRCSQEDKSEIDILIDHYRHYVRGRILSLFTRPLSLEMVKEANLHLQAEHYLKPFDGNFQNIWQTLTGRERVMTKWFWLLLQELTWSVNYDTTNILLDPSYIALEEANGRMATAYSVKFTNTNWIKNATHDFNVMVLQAIMDDDYNHGHIPDVCFSSGQTEVNKVQIPKAKRPSPSKLYTHNSEELPARSTENLDGNKKRSPSDYHLAWSDAEVGAASASNVPMVLTSVNTTSKTPELYDKKDARPISQYTDNPSTDPNYSHSSSSTPCDQDVMGNCKVDSWDDPECFDEKSDTVSCFPAQSSTSSSVDKYQFLYRSRYAEETALPVKESSCARILGEKSTSGFSTSGIAEDDDIGSAGSPSQEEVAGEAVICTVTEQQFPLSAKSSKVHHGGTMGELPHSTIASSSEPFRPYDSLRKLIIDRKLETASPGDARKLAIPPDVDITSESPFFNMHTFLGEVAVHIRTTAFQMLSNGEVDFRALTDTLLCLNDDEYKYLPLWAGGNDDGSGGVFVPDVPPATHGPNGPGPSYHTGSTVNSRASTEVGWDSHSSIDISVAVENGYSDQLDRRIVSSEDGRLGSSSVAFSSDSEDYDNGGLKGKAEVAEPTVKPATSSAKFGLDDDDDDDFMNVSEGEEDW